MRRNPEDVRISELENLVKLGDKQAALELLHILDSMGQLETLNQEFPAYPYSQDLYDRKWSNLLIRPYRQTCLNVFTRPGDTVTLIDRQYGETPAVFNIEFNYLPERFYFHGGFPSRRELRIWIPYSPNKESDDKRTFKFYSPRETLRLSSIPLDGTAEGSHGLARLFATGIRKWVKSHPQEMHLAETLWAKFVLTLDLDKYKAQLLELKKAEDAIVKKMIDWVRLK